MQEQLEDGAISRKRWDAVKEQQPCPRGRLRDVKRNTTMEARTDTRSSVALARRRLLKELFEETAEKQQERS